MMKQNMAVISSAIKDKAGFLENTFEYWSMF